MTELAQKPVSELKLDPRSEDLLSDWVAEKSVHTDERGFYAEFESFDCKPWKPLHVAELVEYGLAEAHEDSDPVPSLSEVKPGPYTTEDDLEPFGGVAFLNLTERGREYLVAHGLTDSLEENA